MACRSSKATQHVTTGCQPPRDVTVGTGNSDRSHPVRSAYAVQIEVSVVRASTAEASTRNAIVARCATIPNQLAVHVNGDVLPERRYPNCSISVGRRLHNLNECSASWISCPRGRERARGQNEPPLRVSEISGMRNHVVGRAARCFLGNPQNVERQCRRRAGGPAVGVTNILPPQGTRRQVAFLEGSVGHVSLPEGTFGAKGVIEHVSPFQPNQIKTSLVVSGGEMCLHLHRSGECSNRILFLWGPRTELVPVPSQRPAHVRGFR